MSRRRPSSMHPTAPRTRRDNVANRTPRSLGEVLASTESPALASLTARAGHHDQLLQRVRAALDAPLNDAIKAASHTDTTLTLVLQSAAWATHLRLQAPTLAPQLAAACGLPCEKLAVRVRPGAGTPTDDSPAD
ncbi:MAG: DciA family protein [Pseudomonadota bacterium]